MKEKSVTSTIVKEKWLRAQSSERKSFEKRDWRPLRVILAVRRTGLSRSRSARGGPPQRRLCFSGDGRHQLCRRGETGDRVRGLARPHRHDREVPVLGTGPEVGSGVLVRLELGLAP